MYNLELRAKYVALESNYCYFKIAVAIKCITSLMKMKKRIIAKNATFV
jgi:hypothetical protein